MHTNNQSINLVGQQSAHTVLIDILHRNYLNQVITVKVKQTTLQTIFVTFSVIKNSHDKVASTCFTECATCTKLSY